MTNKPLAEVWADYKAALATNEARRIFPAVLVLMTHPQVVVKVFLASVTVITLTLLALVALFR